MNNEQALYQIVHVLVDKALLIRGRSGVPMRGLSYPSKGKLKKAERVCVYLGVCICTYPVYVGITQLNIYGGG